PGTLAWRRALASLYRVGQATDVADLHLDDVAGLQEQRRVALEPHATRGAGDDDVARLQRREARDVVDQARDAEDKLGRAGLLHHLAIEPGGQRQFLAVGDLAARDHPRPECAGPVEVLAGCPLRGVLLPVPHRRIVVGRVAGDVVPG